MRKKRRKTKNIMQLGCRFVFFVSFHTTKMDKRRKTKKRRKGHNRQKAIDKTEKNEKGRSNIYLKIDKAL